MQAGKLYDDIVVKLPVLILYGNEENWDKEEKERMIGDQDAFGYKDMVGGEDNKDDVVIECLDENEDTVECSGTKGTLINN
jgi:hypothetical protein